jgi:hypothetical protein
LQANSATVGDLGGLKKSHPLIHKGLIAEIEEFDFTHPPAKNVLEYEIDTDVGKTECFWTYFLKIAIEDLSQTVWLCENRAAIEQELQAVKDKRLMELMQNEKPSRDFDDLR